MGGPADPLMEGNPSSLHHWANIAAQQKDVMGDAYDTMLLVTIFRLWT